MLFILTGDRQCGKTRWLERVCAAIGECGILVSGVIAPGCWVEQVDGTLDKVGIDNVLLPEGERIAFARRRDLAEAEGTFDETSQSAQAGMAWEISEEALATANAHFAALKRKRNAETPAFLVVDELGPLELVREGGLTHAVELLEQGSCAGFPHALVIVRPELVDAAVAQFDMWGGTEVVEPVEEDTFIERICALYQQDRSEA